MEKAVILVWGTKMVVSPLPEIPPLDTDLEIIPSQCCFLLVLRPKGNCAVKYFKILIKVRCNIVQHNLAILIYLMRMMQSLATNPALSLERCVSFLHFTQQKVIFSNLFFTVILELVLIESKDIYVFQSCPCQYCQYCFFLFFQNFLNSQSSCLSRIRFVISSRMVKQVTFTYCLS